MIHICFSYDSHMKGNTYVYHMWRNCLCTVNTSMREKENYQAQLHVPVSDNELCNHAVTHKKFT